MLSSTPDSPEAIDDFVPGDVDRGRRHYGHLGEDGVIARTLDVSYAVSGHGDRRRGDRAVDPDPARLVDRAVANRQRLDVVGIEGAAVSAVQGRPRDRDVGTGVGTNDVPAPTIRHRRVDNRHRGGRTDADRGRRARGRPVACIDPTTRDRDGSAGRGGLLARRPVGDREGEGRQRSEDGPEQSHVAMVLPTSAPSGSHLTHANLPGWARPRCSWWLARSHDPPD